jgi:hypothetical protein
MSFGFPASLPFSTFSVSILFRLKSSQLWWPFRFHGVYRKLPETHAVLAALHTQWKIDRGNGFGPAKRGESLPRGSSCETKSKALRGEFTGPPPLEPSKLKPTGTVAIKSLIALKVIGLTIAKKGHAENSIIYDLNVVRLDGLLRCRACWSRR